MDLKNKLMYIGGAVIGLIILILLVTWIIGLTSDKSLSYSGVESKLVSATKEYAKDKPDLLPSTEDGTNIVTSTELVNGGYMDPISDYLKNKDNCTGEVKIYYSNGNYNYIPILDCGEAYKTAFLYETLTLSPVASGDGLYQMRNGEFTSGNIAADNIKYIFRGEFPNNYIKFGEILWRVVEINENNDMILIADEPTDKYFLWDDRYNVQEKKDHGINDYAKSRMIDYLKETYEPTIPEEMKTLIDSMNICVGGRLDDSKVSDYEEECSKILDRQSIGLLSVSQFTIASLDTNCKTIKDNSCGNYNYLATSKKPWWLTTPLSSDTFNVYYVKGSFVQNDWAKHKYTVRPIVMLGNRAVLESGTGTKTDPYIVK